jgi:hypothetical protein
MRLMIPLAWERWGEGVISGMSDITGVLNTSIKNNVIKMAIIKGIKETFSIIGIPMNPIKARGAPIAIKGLRLPIFVLILSDQAPIKGRMKRAAILSSVITNPVAVALIPNPVTPLVEENPSLPAWRKIGT